MKIVVSGGSGLLGQKLVTRLHERGHEAVAASPAAGVNAVAGAGLADVLMDAGLLVMIQWGLSLLTKRRGGAHLESAAAVSVGTSCESSVAQTFLPVVMMEADSCVREDQL